MSIQHAVIFDMDGTLLQSETLAVPSFRGALKDLKEMGLYEGDLPTDRQITETLGMIAEEIWPKLIPGSDEKTHEIATQLLSKHEEHLVSEGCVHLYPGVIEQITALHEAGNALFVASNAQEGYVEWICDYFSITHLFTDLYSAGRFQTKSKVDLVAHLIKTYNVQDGVMVGDRKSDIEAGKKNGLKTIGCDFGFAHPGELDGAHIKIKSFAEITNHIAYEKVT
ncbi:HAD family hydrolase [Brevibacillus daliensis]|uniref:HAD family hydrolase n=1 Tax=Brevibacillus daliensis TaxID=2892995 RepID=UPI001E34B9CC|nr:HAD family hydrolase [Brevibacillus daliensis]